MTDRCKVCGKAPPAEEEGEILLVINECPGHVENIRAPKVDDGEEKEEI